METNQQKSCYFEKMCYPSKQLWPVWEGQIKGRVTATHLVRAGQWGGGRGRTSFIWYFIFSSTGTGNDFFFTNVQTLQLRISSSNNIFQFSPAHLHPGASLFRLNRDLRFLTFPRASFSCFSAFACLTFASLTILWASWKHMEQEGSAQGPFGFPWRPKVRKRKSNGSAADTHHTENTNKQDPNTLANRREGRMEVNETINSGKSQKKKNLSL